MTRLIVVRHAQSEGNRGHFFTGQTNINLTKDGHRQAEATARFLDAYPADVALSSPLVRVQQTARHTTDRRGMELIIDPGLIEINGGIWEGHPNRLCQEKYPVAWNLWANDIYHSICPGGESLIDLIERIEPAFRRIADTYNGKNVLLFTHATPIRVMTTHWKGLPWRKVNEQAWANNASVTVVRYEDDGSYTLELEAYAEHLIRENLLGGII